MIPKIYLSSLDLIDINDNYKFRKDKLPIIWYLVEKCEEIKETNFDSNIYSNFVFKFIKCLSENNFWYDDWKYDNFMLNSKNEYVITDFDVKKDAPLEYDIYININIIHHCKMFFMAIRVLLQKSLIDNNIKYYNLNDAISWKYALYCFKNGIFSKCINYIDIYDKKLIDRILNKEYLFDDYLRYLLDKNNSLFNKTMYDLYVKCVKSRIIPGDIYYIIDVKQNVKQHDEEDDENENEDEEDEYDEYKEIENEKEEKEEEYDENEEIENEEQQKEQKKQITKIKPILIPVPIKLKI